MALKVAVQMDPIDTIDIAGDTTFALMLEAQVRGHELVVYGPEHLSLAQNRLTARVCPVEIQDVIGDHVRFGQDRAVDLSTLDVVLMRQDPPFDMSYITATHLLEYIHPETLVVNDPAHVRNAPEKLFVARYPDLMPPTLITKDVRELYRFKEKYGDIILKPLYGNGGAGVFKMAHHDENFASLLEMFDQMFREPYIAQQYLPDVKAGDKRIILVDGTIAGAINRIPAEGETRSNMHVGGTPAPTDLTDREQEICDRIGVDLRERGLILVGIDVIGDYLTEINVTSPTGVREVKKFGGNDIAVMTWDAIEQKL